MTEVTDTTLINIIAEIRKEAADVLDSRDLDKVLKGNKTAAVRFRKKTHAMTKLFKEFRQASIKAGLVY